MYVYYIISYIYVCMYACMYVCTRWLEAELDTELAVMRAPKQAFAHFGGRARPMVKLLELSAHFDEAM